MAVISIFGDPSSAVAGAGAGELAWLDVATEDAWLELRRRERLPLAEPLADRIPCLLGLASQARRREEKCSLPLQMSAQQVPALEWLLTYVAREQGYIAMICFMAPEVNQYYPNKGGVCHEPT